MNKTGRYPCPHRVYNPERETDGKRGSIPTQGIGEKHRGVWGDQGRLLDGGVAWAETERCIGTTKRPGEEGMLLEVSTACAKALRCEGT